MTKAKIITVSLTEEQHQAVKDMSMPLTGKSNVSGCIAFLINEKLKELKAIDESKK